MKENKTAGSAVKNLPGIEVRGNSIRVLFTTADGLRHRKTYVVEGIQLAPTGANRKAASELAMKIKAEIRLGVFNMATHFPHDAEVLAAKAEAEAKIRTVAKQLDHWRATLQVEPSTLKGFDSAIRFWKKAPAQPPGAGETWGDMPRLGDLKIDSLLLSHLKAAVMSKAHRRAKTVNNYLNVFKLALDAAVDDKLIADYPPTAKVWREKDQTDDPDAFDLEEMSAIVGEFQRGHPGQVANFCEFWFLTGLRTSEIQGLRWPSVDFRKGLIRIHEVQVRGEHKATTKTKKARLVKLTRRAVEILLAQKKHTFLAGEHVFHDPRFNTCWGDELPFRRTYWTPILKRLGIRYRRPYQMRHTNASMRLTSGQKVGYAAEQMGHSVETFVQHYAKWVHGLHNQAEDDKLEALLTSAPAPQGGALHGFIAGVAVGAK